MKVILYAFFGVPEFYTKEESMSGIYEVIRYFPIEIYNLLKNIFEDNKIIRENIEEIRIRVQKPIILKLRYEDVVLSHIVEQREILQTLEKLCENSIYAYKNQITEGYITVKGGHRVGITGTVVEENGQIINLKYVTSLNFRIARQVLNCSNKIIKEVLDIENHSIFTTLIVAPPGKGKTTILRDLIRRISNGMENINFKGKTCGVVDERGEIAAMYKGIPQNDIGMRTDVIENVSKYKGMKILIRTMAPEIIACDEIGTKEDIEAIEEAMTAGIKGIFTIHGKNMEDIKNNKEVYKLVENKQIEKIIFL